VDGAKGVSASAFLHKENKTLTIVLVNKSGDAEDTTVQLPDDFSSVKSLDSVTSSNGSLWQEATVSPAGGRVKLSVPAYGVVTLFAKNS